MRFLLDESVEYRLAGMLADQGHDVTAIARDYPHGIPDEQVLSIAKIEERILLTNDSDFGELIVRHRQAHAGVIYFRLPAATVQLKFERLQNVLVAHRHQLSQFLTVTQSRVRIRVSESN